MEKMDNPFLILINRIDQFENRILELLSNNHNTKSKDRIGGMSLACEVLKGIYSKQTIYSLVSAGKIPHSKRGKMLIFSERELTHWVTENKKKTKEEIIKESKGKI
ncbi:MAG: helix-turn-helix domain-containing protein [Bacteroidia bacterium]|nr:helix-turn-helix domain-containing protein [Bacteroidia bacterium]